MSAWARSDNRRNTFDSIGRRATTRGAMPWRCRRCPRSSDLVWTEFHPFEAIPQVVAPKSGFVANAHHTPYRATSRDENPNEADFPEWGIETRMTNRGLRLLELYGSDESITAEEFRAYNYNKRYSVDSAAQRIVAEVLALDFGDDVGLVAAPTRSARSSPSCSNPMVAPSAIPVTATSSSPNGPRTERRRWTRSINAEPPRSTRLRLTTPIRFRSSSPRRPGARGSNSKNYCDT